MYPTHLIHNKSEMIELIEILVVSGVSFFEQDFVNSNLIYILHLNSQLDTQSWSC